MPRILGVLTMPTDERFDEKFVINPATGCHEWTAALNGFGKHKYGCFYIGPKANGKPKLVKAHRFSYERAKGKIPAGMQLDHLCRNTRCVNPAHLEPVSMKENLRRGQVSRKKVRTHCLKGHELTGDNLYVRPEGVLQCRICRRGLSNAHYARHASRKEFDPNSLPPSAGLLSLAFL